MTAPPAAQLWLGGGALLWLLYWGVFVVTGNGRPVPLVGDAFANVAPLVAVSAATHLLLRDRVIPLSVPRQVLAHAVLAPCFGLVWYALVTVLLGFVAGLRGGGFAPVGFGGQAVVWQAFQGLIFYALVAAVCYAIRRPAPPRQDAAPLRRYLVRDGEGIRPVDVSRIVRITGAQDYAEVAATDGTHLVRMSLTEFERRLDPRQFARVHRSAIINLDRLRLAESAGGGGADDRAYGGWCQRAGQPRGRDPVARSRRLIVRVRR